MIDRTGANWLAGVSDRFEQSKRDGARAYMARKRDEDNAKRLSEQGAWLFQKYALLSPTGRARFRELLEADWNLHREFDELPRSSEKFTEDIVDAEIIDDDAETVQDGW